MVLIAFENHPERAESLALYQIPNVVMNKIMCDFDVQDHTEQDDNDENFNHSYTDEYYRCSRCGRVRVKHDDSWGGITWYER